MANFAAQLKDKLPGLVDRVVSCGGRGAGAGANKDVPEAPAKLPNVQVPLAYEFLSITPHASATYIHPWVTDLYLVTVYFCSPLRSSREIPT